MSSFLLLTQERSNYNTSKGRPTLVYPMKVCGGGGLEVEVQLNPFLA